MFELSEAVPFFFLNLLGCCGLSKAKELLNKVGKTQMQASEFRPVTQLPMRFKGLCLFSGGFEFYFGSKTGTTLGCSHNTSFSMHFLLVPEKISNFWSSVQLKWRTYVRWPPSCTQKSTNLKAKKMTISAFWILEHDLISLICDSVRKK